MHPLERIAALELERDALRERLASFERGEPDAAYRAELKRLQEQRQSLRAENDELRRRIGDVGRQRRRRFARFDATVMEEVLQTLWRLIDRR